MLKLFRDNLRHLSWVLWGVILVFILLIFVDVGAFQPKDAEGGPNAPAAWAGDIVVRFSEYESAYRRLESYQRQLFQGNIPDAFQEQLKVQALQDAFDFKLMLAEAKDMGLKISNSELRKSILEIPAFLDENGKFIGEEKYKNLLARSGFRTAQEFENSQREQLLYIKLDSILRDSAFVSDKAVEEAFRNQSERAKIRYVLLPIRQLADSVTIEEADLASYFETHKEEYRLPEQRRIAYLVVDNSVLRAKMEVSPEDIEAYYQAHSEDYQQEEQVRARHILIKTDERTQAEADAELEKARQRIVGGEPFETVARELSEDPGSAASGGDLRYFPRGRMVPQFEEAAFGAKVGELVGPVHTPFGAHLLEVTARRESGLRPLDEVRAQVRHKILTERVSEEGNRLAGELLARLKDAGSTSEEELQSIADESETTKLVVTDPFGQQDTIAGIGRSPEFSSAAFALKPGELSELVKLPRGWAVLTLKEVLEPRIPELSVVQAQVRDAVRIQKQRDLARQKLEQARQSIDAGESFDEVAKGLDLEVKESGELSRGGALPDLGAASGKVIEAALSMEEGAVGGPYEYPQGETLVQVTERQHMDPADFEAQKEATRERLEAQEYQRLRASVLNQRKIDLNVQYASSIVADVAEDDQVR
ncbi:MAG: peptidyl-prolyl cis-trans isomerase [Acidobacteria bacterium]|nr:peptidyl-prolyl cis-trans isomerase [Acidobacteriota bacterium]